MNPGPRSTPSIPGMTFDVQDSLSSELQTLNSDKHNEKMVNRASDSSVGRYKPLALRLPSLIGFLAIFGVCIGLIEGLLAETRRSPDLNSSSAFSTREQLFCSHSSEFATQIESLESRYSSICSNYSELFEPAPTKNSPGQQAIFRDWSLSFYDFRLSQGSTKYDAQHCYESTAASPTDHVEMYNTAGCTSTPLSYSKNPCGPGGYWPVFEMETGVLTATWDVVACSMASEKMLVITEPSMTTLDMTRTSTYHTILQTTNSVGDRTKVIDWITTTITPSAKARANFTLSAEESRSEQPFTKFTYFLAVFLAPILAVLIKVMWDVVYTSFKLVEPFQRMRTARGAPAKDVLLLQYLSGGWSLQTTRTFWQHKAQTLWLLIMYLLVQIGAPLASAAMSVRAQSICLSGGYEVRCNPAWVIRRPIMRCLEAVLATCAILIMILIVSIWNHGFVTGENPSSIASIASMLGDGTLLDEMRCIPPGAGEAEFAHALESRSYMLTLSRTSASHTQLKLMKETTTTSDHESSPNHGLLALGRFDKSKPIFKSDSRVRVDERLLKSTQDRTSFRSASILDGYEGLVSDNLGLAAISSLLGILVAYYLDGSSSPFNTFFSSQSILSKMVFVGLAVVADIQFKGLEHHVRVMEPYRRLSQGGARPETTILLHLNGTCWSNVPQCVYYVFCLNDSRMLWQAVVTAVACLSDFNIIALPGVMFSDAQTVESLLACWYITMTITSLMLLTMVVALVWWRRVDVVRNMPRRPETIGAVISYLCGSKMTSKIAGRAENDSVASKRAFREKSGWEPIVRAEERFRFGKWISPIDERVRWSIEYELQAADVWA